MSPVAAGASGARVVGIDIPTSPSAMPMQGVFPRRTASMRASRDPPNSRGGLVFSNKEGVAPGGVVDSRGKRNKPRRSNSLNYHSKESGSDLELSTGTSGRVQQYTIPGATHQYPLRETVSLTQLQGGDFSRSRRQYGGAVSSGQALNGSGLGNMSLKSSSMRTLPSSHVTRIGYTQGSMESLPSYKVRTNGVW